MTGKRIPKLATEVLEAPTTCAPVDPVKEARDRRRTERSRDTRARTTAAKVDAGQQDMLSKYFDLDLLVAVKAQRNFKTFVQTAWPILHPSRPYIDTWHMDAVCEHLEALYKGKIKNLLVTIPPGHSKPIDVESLILMEDGSRKRLGAIEIGDRVITHMGSAATVLEVHAQGDLDVLEIVTNNGRSVSTAYDHPFLTPEGWVAAGDLRVGQSLASVPDPKTTGKSSRSLEEFRLAGYFVGDGCSSLSPSSTTCNASITCFDAIEREDILTCTASLGFSARIPNDRRQGIHLKGGVRPWLKEVGLSGKVARTKRVPPWVFTGTNEQISNFVGAYFACDGTLTRPHYRSNNKLIDFRIEFCSVSRGLILDVQHLLLRLGIHGRVCYRKVKYKYKDNPIKLVDSWHLIVSTQEETAKFYGRIPIYHEKAERLASWKPLRKDFDRQLLPDKIVSIEVAGKKACRCLTLDQVHTFTANDLVVHNSLLSAVFLPCWAWLDDPTTAFLYLSFAHELSSRDSGKCLTVMRSPWYKKFFGYKFVLSRQSALKITNDQQGYRIATSVEATAAMGERGDVLVGDDALSIKDGQKSEAKRTAVNKIWDDAFCSRAKDGATLRKLIIQQRIHMDDLAGHVLDQGGWTHLNLPAEYVPEKRCQTYIDSTLFWEDPREVEGDLLFPQLFNEDHMAEERKKPAYSAIYQQNPVPEGGGIIKTVWLMNNHYNESPSIIAAKASKVIQSWDTAQKKGSRTSFTVGQVWAKLDADFYLIDEIRDRMEFVDIIRAIKRLTKLWPMCQEKLIEDKSSGSDVISQLQGKIPGIIPVPVNDDGKLDRLDAVSWVFEGGNIRIPREIVDGRVPRRIEWIPAWIEELTAAPVGKYMDRVDSATQAIQRMIKLSASLYATPIGVGSTTSWTGGSVSSDHSGWGEMR